jgi:hypothetical protein
MTSAIALGNNSPILVLKKNMMAATFLYIHALKEHERIMMVYF